MEYTVEITVNTIKAIDEAMLERVAERGGFASGHVGQHRLNTTLTVDQPSVPEAARSAIETMEDLARGQVVCLEVMTTAEQDRRLEEPRPEYVGLAEVADMLGISRQRASTLSQRNDFPAPAAHLAATPVWLKGDLSTFKEGWQRKPGRPRKSA